MQRFRGGIFRWIPGPNSRRRASAIAAVAVGFALSVSTASAQNLQALVNSAQNSQQKSLAQNVIVVCPALGNLSMRTAAQDDLFGRCTGAILLGDDGQAANAATALDQMAAQELLTQESVVNGTVQPQTRAIAARLSALGGHLGGAQMASLYPTTEVDGIQLASAQPIEVVAQGSGMSASFPSGLGVFLNGSYNFGNKDQTSLESGFGFDDYSVTGGVDYYLVDNLVVGISGGYTFTDIEIDNNAGDIEGNAYTVGLYGLWNPMDQLGLSLYSAYSRINYDSTRNLSYVDLGTMGTPTQVTRKINSDTDADQFEVTGNANYDFTSGPWTFGPTLRLSYLDTSIDGFTETGGMGLNMVFEDQNADSFQTGLGGAASHAISTDFGIVSLQGRAEWVHEYLDDSRTVTTRFQNDPIPGTSPPITYTTDNPDRDRFRLGAGASAVFQGGISTFADFETVLGHEDVESYSVTAGLRMEF